MEGTYQVCLHGQQAGTAVLVRRGLYYELCCRCAPADGRMLHLMLQAKELSMDLGLLVPVAGSLELKKQIPVSRMGEGQPTFFLRERNESKPEFFLVKAEEPFSYLHLLRDAYLVQQEGNTGIGIRKKTTEKAENRG